jgi:excisionase family DNA binding protein
MPDRTSTISEVAARYGVSIPTVRSWIASGELRALVVSRNPRSKKPRVRVTAEALRAFEATRSPSLAPAARRRRRENEGVTQYY